jgi:hypothetical protein
MAANPEHNRDAAALQTADAALRAVLISRRCIRLIGREPLPFTAWIHRVKGLSETMVPGNIFRFPHNFSLP